MWADGGRYGEMWADGGRSGEMAHLFIVVAKLLVDEDGLKRLVEVVGGDDGALLCDAKDEEGEEHEMNEELLELPPEVERRLDVPGDTCRRGVSGGRHATCH